MGTDSRTDADTKTSLETHQETLETENITLVDDLNDEISAILEETPDLQYDYLDFWSRPEGRESLAA